MQTDRRKKKAPAGTTPGQGVTPGRKWQEWSKAEVDRSVDEWRASQGLPPIDRGRKREPDGNE